MNIKCFFGLHKWEHPLREDRYPADWNVHDRIHRHCVCCGKKQSWNYTIAREQGLIVWEDRRD